MTLDDGRVVQIYADGSVLVDSHDEGFIVIQGKHHTELWRRYIGDTGVTRKEYTLPNARYALAFPSGTSTRPGSRQFYMDFMRIYDEHMAEKSNG